MAMNKQSKDSSIATAANGTTYLKYKLSNRQYMLYGV